jgi:hypothetical protein
MTLGMASTGAPISGACVLGNPDIHPNRMACYIIPESLSAFWMTVSFTVAKISRKLLVSEASVML